LKNKNRKGGGKEGKAEGVYSKKQERTLAVWDPKDWQLEERVPQGNDGWALETGEGRVPLPPLAAGKVLGQK